MELEPVTLSSLAIAGAVYCAFFFALLGAAMVLPGPVMEGFPAPDGTRKRYKMNGLALYVGTHIVLGAGVLVLGWSPAHLIRYFWSYFAVVNVFAFAWTGVLYRSGQRRRTAKPRGEGAVGVVVDLWLGVELNPTWRGVDLKVFAYQPSLIGLEIMNVAFAFAQWEQHGALTPQMIAYQAFWWLYFTTHYLREVNVLSMWDVIAEEFGFMLVWGDLVLVTFFYCIGGWWLLDDPRGPMDPLALAGLCAMFGLGLWIFRGANAQKDRFKRDPDAKIWGRPPETLGGRLLVSGWWGIGRKLNYTAEIMLYGAIALLTGFQSIAPYLLPLWLCVLLSHRAWRDEKRCRAKYGELWDQYCARAKFRMIPFVY